ncbi:MAG: hypothetical protein ABL898_08425 [Hyphomicrobiaceae bacterium]|nr:hypothetical protein [Hyphomicrobiaceae bacterium]
MQILQDLTARLESEDSYFQQYLIKEDIARLNRVYTGAQAAADETEYRKSALYQGWSTDDLRTGELLPKLEPLLAAIWQFARANGDDQLVSHCWREFDQLRMERLLGCLSRVPQLDENGV